MSILAAWYTLGGMKTKIDVVRALSFVVVKRVLGVMTVIGIVGFGLSFALIWLFAAHLSGWWWLLLIVWIPLLIVALIIRLGVGYLAVKFLYQDRLDKQQKQRLNAFADKLQRLVETRTLGWPTFALMNIKDLVFHRKLRTTQDLIADSTSLKKDFQELEKLFKS